MVRKLFFILLFVLALLMVLEFIPETFSTTLDNRFDLNEEANIPTWFSTMLLFSIAITAQIIYQLGKTLNISTKMQRFWLVFSGVYCFLSMDEAARIHEIFWGSLNIKWIYIYAPVALIFFIYCVKVLCLNEQNRRLRNWLIGGLLLYACGGLIGETIDHFFGRSQIGILYEESLEIFGTILVLRGCLQELECYHQNWLGLKLREQREESPSHIRSPRPSHN